MTVAAAGRHRPPARRGTALDWLARAAVFTWLGLLVVLPLATLAASALSGGPGEFLVSLGVPYAAEALVLTLWTAALTSGIGAVTGTATAWVLVRYRFPGRALLSALVDLPFAIPTLVTGLMVVYLFRSQTVLGAWMDGHGLPVAFAPAGIVLVLQFITLPFVVRAVEPVLAGIDPAEEEAASTLGASPARTFLRVLLPPLLPAIAGGTLQGFARALAEFGSIVVVSGNIPGRTLTAPIFIFGEVEAGRTSVATAVSLVLLVLALLLQPAVRGLYRAAGAARA